MSTVVKKSTTSQKVTLPALPVKTRAPRTCKSMTDEEKRLAKLEANHRCYARRKEYERELKEAQAQRREFADKLLELYEAGKIKVPASILSSC